MSVAVLVASQGKNLELAQQLMKILDEQKQDAKLVDLVDCGLPIYSGRRQESGMPKELATLVQPLEKAKAFIVLAPEYNGGIPPVLNNALAWLSVNAKDWRVLFNDKPCLIGTHSGGGGTNALNMMRVQLAYVGMNVLGRVIHTHGSKPLNTDSARDAISRLLKLV